MLPSIQNQKSKIGFYFHIPFCPHICPYCDFVKTSRFLKKDVDAYFNELYSSLDSILEQKSNSEYMANLKDCTVYFGGGTPGLFDAKFYAPILEKISKNFDLEEVTIETNPFSNRRNFISGYRDIGINRVTLGAQSLCQNTLKVLGRKHQKNDVMNNIRWLRESGMHQVQVDLIYGLSTERSVSVEEEIRTVISEGATGISAYGLTIESRTMFAKLKHQTADDDTIVKEYESIVNTCTDLGLRQIETSNFSFFDAKHNNLYWYGYPYFGLGTGAHGLLPPNSFQDLCPTSKQSSSPHGVRYKVGMTPLERSSGDDLLIFNCQNECSKNFQFIFESTRTRANMIAELVFTLLRTEYGIPIDWLISVTNDKIIESSILKHAQIKRGLDENKIILTSTHLKLAPYEKIRGDAWALILINILEMIYEI